MSGVFYIIARAYVMRFEVCPITQIIPDIFQTSLHKHGTIKQNTADTPQTSLHKHGRITQITFGVRNDLCYCAVFM
jgi:hypothetical protein